MWRCACSWRPGAQVRFEGAFQFAASRLFSLATAPLPEAEVVWPGVPPPLVYRDEPGALVEAFASIAGDGGEGVLSRRDVALSPRRYRLPVGVR